jgi:hypothetical protein
MNVDFQSIALDTIMTEEDLFQELARHDTTCALSESTEE